MPIALWRVTLTGTQQTKKTQIQVQILTTASSAKSAIHKAQAHYNMFSITVHSTEASRVAEDCYQIPTALGPTLRRK